MKRLATICAVLGLTVAAGCQDNGKSDTEGRGAGEGINIEFPGGSVKVGEGGVDVQAPGVDVKVDSKKGVDVKAPGVGVQVERDKKVGVQAPGVDFQLDSTTTEDE